MIRLLVLSDSHGGCYTVGRVLDRHPEAQHVIHLGDGASDLEEFAATCRARLLQVAGNCDFACAHPGEQEVKIGGVPLFFTHGHTYGVKHGLGRLEVEARRRGVRLAMFGHTHEAVCRYEDGLYLFNPGSLRFGGTYGIVDITDGGIAVNTANRY